MEEVLNPESLETLKNIPITLTHPRTLIDKNYSGIVGHTNSEISDDGFRVYAGLEINNKEALDSIISKKANKLSCGYECEHEWKPGKWMGVNYDCIQRNIRYNHVALVDEPRGDESLEIKLDGKNVVWKPEKTGEGKMDEQNKTLEALQSEYKVKLDAADKAASDLKTEISALKANNDAAVAKLDAINAEFAKFKEDSKSEMEKKLAEQRETFALAQKHGVEFKEDSTELSILSAALLKRNDKIDLSGKSLEYVRARLDAAAELEAAHLEASKANNETIGAPRMDSAVSADAAREKMVKQLKGEG